MTDVSSEDSLPGSWLPAVYADRFTSMLGDPLTRLAFGEAVTLKEINYRSVLVMTTNDAIALANLILELVRKRKAEQTDQESGATGSG
jgi:hypothetical protein